MGAIRTLKADAEKLKQQITNLEVCVRLIILCGVQRQFSIAITYTWGASSTIRDTGCSA